MSVVTIYWCKFFGLSGRIAGGERLEAADDNAAISKTHVLYATGLLSRYEIWEDKRLVHNKQVDRGR
jgi:hypothetical protein